MNNLINKEDLQNTLDSLECKYPLEDLYWSKEGNVYSLYSQSSEPYSAPLEIVEVES